MILFWLYNFTKNKEHLRDKFKQPFIYSFRENSPPGAIGLFLYLEYPFKPNGRVLITRREFEISSIRTFLILDS